MAHMCTHSMCCATVSISRNMVMVNCGYDSVIHTAITAPERGSMTRMILSLDVVANALPMWFHDME